MTNPDNKPKKRVKILRKTGRKHAVEFMQALNELKDLAQEIDHIIHYLSELRNTGKYKTGMIEMLVKQAIPEWRKMKEKLQNFEHTADSGVRWSSKSSAPPKAEAQAEEGAKIVGNVGNKFAKTKRKWEGKEHHTYFKGPNPLTRQQERWEREALDLDLARERKERKPKT